MRLCTIMLSVALLAGSAGLARAAGSDQVFGSATKAQATTMTDAQVRQKLEAQGYTNVQIRERDKGHIDVTAAKNGKSEKLAINPQSGQVTPDSDKRDVVRSRHLLLADTLAGMRDLLPPGLVRSERQPGDPPEMVGI